MILLNEKGAKSVIPFNPFVNNVFESVKTKTQNR
jgi:hypothetical protein